MVEITDINGGTVVFRIVGSDVGGEYRLQTSFRGRPEPLFRDGVKLDLGSDAEAEILNALRTWIADASADEAKGPPDESDGIPNRIAWCRRMADLGHLRYVAQRLEERCDGVR
jgi:hypothetical protein